ncbi:MAG: PAS domain-containing protein [Elusimicrobiota bacterium]
MNAEAEYYRSVLDNLTGGFLSVNLSGILVYINPTAGRILRLSDVSSLIGKPFTTALSGWPALSGVIEETLSTHKTVHRAELTVMHADCPLVIGYSTLQVTNRAGDHLGIGIIFQDLTFTPCKAG